MNLTYHTDLMLCGLILEAFFKSEKKSSFFHIEEFTEKFTRKKKKAREDDEERIRVLSTSIFSSPDI